MIETYYLSNLNSEQIEKHTGLALDEVEELMGRFSSRSQWANKLRGEVRVYCCGKIELFEHFKNKKNPRGIVWTN